MASGIWTCNRFWYDPVTTESCAGACVEACRAEKLTDLFFTLWGDDPYCDIDSAWAGIIWAAETCYSDGGRASSRAVSLSARFRAMCGGDYEAVVRAGTVLNQRYGVTSLYWGHIAPVFLDDPLYGLYASGGNPPPDWITWADVVSSLEHLAADLIAMPPHDMGAGDLEFAAAFAETLAKKMRTRQRLVEAYDARDAAKLAAVARDALDTAERLGKLETVWRRGWMRRNRPQGWETIAARVGALAGRHRELAHRLDEYLNGDAPSIPELDDRLHTPTWAGGGWRHLATPSALP